MPTMGNIQVGHHDIRKVHVLSGHQIFAFAGDVGQGARVRMIAELGYNEIGNYPNPLLYALAISKAIFEQFTSTGIGNCIAANVVLGFSHNNEVQCSLFEGQLQPRLMDKEHFYAALGTGKLSADPFLRFLVDTFCTGQKQPNVREAVFLATWAVQHVIPTRVVSQVP